MVKPIIILTTLLILSFASVTQSPICDVCHVMVRTFQKSVPKKPLLPILQRIALQYCARKHIQDRHVCKGAVKEMSEYILSGLWRHYTDPHLICQDIFLCSKQYIKRDLKTDIQNTIKDKPNKDWEKPTGRRTLKIVHISDLHPDLYYTEGMPVDCTEPVCCRVNSTAKDNSTKKAGYWGSVGTCDLPIQTFQLFLKDIEKLQPDAIIWTGDNTPHDIWQQTQSYNLNYTMMLAQKIKQKTDAVVIPAMGNHESWPVNVYDYRPNSEREWVLKAGLAQAWRFWMDENAIKMQREKGYFSMTYPHLNNLKVLSINTQAGNDENWLLLQDISDPGNTLQWIESQLKQSQKKSQMVYLIGHIPPKSNLNDWSMRFNALVDRYSYIIRGQFYGHTHSDHISWMPQMKNTSNFTYANLSSFYLVSPSLTTYSDRNPSYRVMDVDFDTLQVKDYTQYKLDVKRYTRKDQNASFEQFYKFKSSYKIDDMTVKGGMTDFRNKLRDDPEMRKLYDYHRCGGLCSGSTDKHVFCDSTSSPQFETECNGEKLKKSAFQKAAGPWREWKHKD